MDQQLQEVPAPAEDLLRGADAIAQFLYGSQERRRDVYRNVLELTFFKHGNTIAAFKSTLRAELKDREQAARQERQNRPKPPAPVVKRRRIKRRAA
jgi:hypothetical protein